MTRIFRWSLGFAALCACMALLLPTNVAWGQEDESTQIGGDADSLCFHLKTTKRLLGDPGGIRQSMEDAGIKFTFILGNTTSMVFRGGLNTSETINNGGRAFYIFEADLEKMGLIDGGSLYLRLLQEWGEGPAADIGTRSAPYWLIASGGDNSFSWDKWWYKQVLFDGKLEFRLGKILNIVDLFDRNAYAANYLNQFSNSVFNYTPLIPAARSVAAYVKVQPTDWLDFRAGAFDAQGAETTCSHGFNGFDTAFGNEAWFYTLYELGAKVNLPSANGDLPGKYRLGGWYDPREKTVYSNTAAGAIAGAKRQNGDYGLYLNFDQMVWKENAEPACKQGLGVFARYGYANGRANAAEHFWSLGASYLGLVPERDEDTLAFGIAQTIMSKDMRKYVNGLADRETVYELYYAIKVAPWLVITPDLQLITNPGGNKDARDALIGGVRLKIVF